MRYEVARALIFFLLTLEPFPLFFRTQTRFAIETANTMYKQAHRFFANVEMRNGEPVISALTDNCTGFAPGQSPFAHRALPGGPGGSLWA